ncbi:hypothetical protein CEXT_20771 [Caerostris extrusa]|uniref:Uncharacterized protein n=1 Tax=Caerostris extrusa TaxID=172846 RepID=A0AAV4QQX7_CAEEX|nr:hypothetical protein CEXT_20771 [Caerostris extrusa]
MPEHRSDTPINRTNNLQNQMTYLYTCHLAWPSAPMELPSLNTSSSFLLTNDVERVENSFDPSFENVGGGERALANKSRCHPPYLLTVSAKFAEENFDFNAKIRHGANWQQNHRSE